MKDKIECMIAAIMIVLSVCFIAWTVDLVIPRYLFTAILFLYAIYIIYRAMKPKRRYYFVSYAHSKGFGALSLNSKGYLFRKEAEIFINKEYFGGKDSIVILFYKELSKEEYEVQKNEGHDE